jgi:NADH:ubiquinone oxidoreductase subunit 5 (subunit L)/multisubunit Na+/H+ antiporter MnhA subunit
MFCGSSEVFGYLSVDVVKWFVEVSSWLCTLLSDGTSSFTVFVWLILVLYILLVLFAVVYMNSDVRILEFIAKYVLFIVSIWLVFTLLSLFCCIVAWELLGIASFFLIGHYVLRSIAVRSSHQALLFNKIGDYFTYAWSSCIG